MLFINKKEVKASDVGKIIGYHVPLDKIKKKPLFEINPALMSKDPANGAGAIKCRQSMEFPAVFFTKSKTGETLEIRYATTSTPDMKTLGQSNKYSPRMVEFDGKAEFIGDDLDKAVYYWLHFYNEGSPFRAAGIPFDYSLVDDDAKANKLISELTLKGKATSHAAALNEDEMILIAKGMKIPGASSMELLMVRAQLMQYASNSPAQYLAAAQSTVNQVKGLIYDSIDKLIFVCENTHNIKRWKWGKGPKEGQLIFEMSSTVQDENEALINHISQSPGAVNEIIPILIGTVNTLKGNTKQAENFAGIDVFAQLNLKGASEPGVIVPILEQAPPFENPPADDEVDEDYDETPPTDEERLNALAGIYLPLPKDFEESKEYLMKHIGNKKAPLTSRLNKGVADGSITLENIEEVLEEMRAV